MIQGHHPQMANSIEIQISPCSKFNLQNIQRNHQWPKKKFIPEVEIFWYDSGKKGYILAKFLPVFEKCMSSEREIKPQQPERFNNFLS